MVLRVVGGSASGVVLRQPGRATRPSSARLREALFSILESADLLHAPALDLYAGSGALGIEALSRGIGQCTFVEQDRRACRVITENLARSGVAGGQVVQGRVGRWRADGALNARLVIADPPYDDDGAWASIESSLEGGLAKEAAIVLEHTARSQAPAELVGVPLWRDRRYGDGALAFYCWREGDPSE